MRLRALQWLVAGALLLAANGCATRRAEPAFSPELYAIVPLIDPTKDPAGMQREYLNLFPDYAALAANGEMVVRRRWAPGAGALRLGYAAAGPERVRLKGSRQVVTVFEMLAADGRLTVRVNGDEPVAFSGAIAPGESPLREAWGIEPGDIWRMLRIGRTIGDGHWTAKRGWGKIVLKAQDIAADGLQSIVLDAETRLPREARWKRGKASWTVRFEKWGMHGPGRRLAPDSIAIRPSRPAVTITLDFAEANQGNFSYLDAEPRTMFTPLDLGSIEPYSLEQLAEVLRQL